MTARAVTTHTHTQRLPSTLQAKLVDNARPHKAQGDLSRVIVGGVSVPADATRAIKDLLARRGRLARESAERKAKRKRPAKNPWSGERKAAARLRRSLEIRAAYEAYWSKVTTGVEPTECQKKLVGQDWAREEREWRNKTAELAVAGLEPWSLAKKYAVSRAREGYRGKAGMLAGGNPRYVIQQAFTETWLRSMLSAVLQRFVMATPAAGRRRKLADGTAMQPLMGGPAKDNRREYWSKIEALDQPYITLLSVLRAGWRQELDRDFASWDQLRGYVTRKVRKRRLACLPHVVVGHVDETGKLCHPHLWWLLPEDSEVWDDRSDTRCRRKPIDLYDAVVIGSFYELQDLGADAGGLGNAMDGKNPLSPQWSFQVWNEDIYPPLQEWAQCVQTWHRREHLVREQAISNSAMDAHVSNGTFTDGSTAAWNLLRNAHRSGDRRYLELLRDRRALADWLMEGLLPGFARLPDQTEVCGILRRVARYVSGKWSPHTMEPSRRRGIAYAYVRSIKCRDDNGKVMAAGVAERQAVGGRVSAAMKKAATIDAIVTAMEELAEADLALTIDNVKPRVDRHSGTVARNWSRHGPPTMPEPFRIFGAC